MFENRVKGAELAKNVSYLCFVCIVLVIIAAVLAGQSILALNAVFYAIIGIILYFLSTRYSDNSHTWIAIIICGIITLIWTLSILGLVIAILLVVAGNDMRKELD